MLTLPQATDQIGRYQILSELGRGSMGQVYLALDPNIDRRVALKVFLPLLKVGAKERYELRRRFILEAKAAGRVEHPGIVTIFDADTDLATDLSFIAMEWIDGRSLQEVLAENRPVAPGRAVEIVEQVAVALDAAHRQGLVHRDVKPGNILCGRDGAIKVTDFGIAKLASMSITHSNWIPGSPFYMSPEQLRNEEVDHRSDVYSLGAVLYECLTGSVPFEGDSLPSLTYMILEIDPRPPQTLAPSIDEALARIAMKALAKSPQERFQSALEFAQALGKVARARPERSAATAAPPPALEPVTAVGAGTAALPPPSPPPEAASRSGAASIAAWTCFVLLLVVGAFGLRHGLSSVGSSPLPAGLPVMTVQSPARFDTGSGATGVLDRIDPVSLPDPPPIEGVEPPAPTPGPLPSPRRSAPAPRQATPAAVSPPRAPVRTGNLEIVFRNRLKAGSISVWLDETKIWERSIAGSKNVVKRTLGKDVFAILPIPVGEHLLDVRVSGAEGKLDLVRRTDLSVVAGQTQRLRVSLVPPRSLRLSLKEPEDG